MNKTDNMGVEDGKPPSDENALCDTTPVGIHTCVDSELSIRSRELDFVRDYPSPMFNIRLRNDLFILDSFRQEQLCQGN